MSDEKPLVEHVRDDQAELFRKWHGAVVDHLEQNRESSARQRAEKATKDAYGVRECLYVMVERIPAKEGQPDRWKASCIAGLPAEIPQLVALVDGTPQDALHECRFVFAELLCKARVCKDMDAARGRAAQAELVLAEVIR